MSTQGKPPHPATVTVERAPHAAAVQRRVAPFGAAKALPPHPATVTAKALQRHPATLPTMKTTQRAPHAATVQRKQAPIGAPLVRPPHPATVIQRSDSGTDDKTTSASTDPIARIKDTDLTKLKSQDIGNSRPKPVYFFDVEGAPTTKPKAAYIVDKLMDKDEIVNYIQMAEKFNLRVPRLYGEHPQGGPIVEWIPNALTVDVTKHKGKSIFAQIQLDKVTKKPFDIKRWQTALGDITHLVEINYSSPDLQFMIQQDGHICFMDLESNNQPKLGSSPDAGLVKIAEELGKVIVEQSKE